MAESCVTVLPGHFSYVSFNRFRSKDHRLLTTAPDGLTTFAELTVFCSFCLSMLIDSDGGAMFVLFADGSTSFLDGVKSCFSPLLFPLGVLLLMN